MSAFLNLAVSTDLERTVTLLRFAEFLQLGFPKSDHVSNGITIAHVIAFGKTELQELYKLQ